MARISSEQDIWYPQEGAVSCQNHSDAKANVPWVPLAVESDRFGAKMSPILLSVAFPEEQKKGYALSKTDYKVNIFFVTYTFGAKLFLLLFIFGKAHHVFRKLIVSIRIRVYRKEVEVFKGSLW